MLILFYYQVANSLVQSRFGMGLRRRAIREVNFVAPYITVYKDNMPSKFSCSLTETHYNMLVDW